MKKGLLKAGFLLTISLLLITGCAEDGEPGPKGDPGIEGEQGEKGDKGEPGTANVIYSEWIETPWDDALATSKVGILAENINFDRDKDVVLVYGEDGLATILPYLDTNIGDYYTFVFAEGSILLSAASISGNLRKFDVFSSYRYIIIPGEQSTSSRTNTKSPDYTDYKATMAYYNIPE
ncbi:collagen-like protein [Marivirga sp. S37H4]|uniref:Collagen-like protein n=1 Tax=Marivirga aurantiaca TaxID=2802615 RepID=A0A935C9L3_9BACT|nr:collagen-like protein [Marivirga aurantiaca]MBK6264328.1 collagen-like protein [Marivirga aurantiaca]